MALRRELLSYVGTGSIGAMVGYYVGAQELLGLQSGGEAPIGDPRDEQTDTNTGERQNTRDDEEQQVDSDDEGQQGQTGNGTAISFEQAALGAPKPAAPWYIEANNGQHEITDSHSTDGDQTLHLSGDGSIDELAAGIPLDLTPVAEVVCDLYIERANPSVGDLALHIDALKDNKEIPFGGRVDFQPGQYTDISGDLSAYTGMHDLYLRSRGENEAYFDNLRFYDENNELLPPAELLSGTAGTDSESGSDGHLSLPFTESFQDGLNGWRIDHRYRTAPSEDPPNPSAGEGEYSTEYGGSVRLHVSGGPSTIGVGRKTDGISEETILSTTVQVKDATNEPGNISLAVFAPDGDDSPDERTANNGRVTNGEIELTHTVEESYSEGAEIRVWADVWPGEFTAYVTTIRTQ